VHDEHRRTPTSRRSERERENRSNGLDVVHRGHDRGVSRDDAGFLHRRRLPRDHDRPSRAVQQFDSRHPVQETRGRAGARVADHEHIRTDQLRVLGEA
jgi:hypothetical protein